MDDISGSRPGWPRVKDEAETLSEENLNQATERLGIIGRKWIMGSTFEELLKKAGIENPQTPPMNDSHKIYWNNGSVITQLDQDVTSRSAWPKDSAVADWFLDERRKMTPEQIKREYLNEPFPKASGNEKN